MAQATLKFTLKDFHSISNGKILSQSKGFCSAHTIKLIWYSKGSSWKTEKYTLKQCKNLKYCTTTRISFTRSLNPLDIKEYLFYKVKRIIRILIIAFFSLSVWQDTRFNLNFLLITARKQKKKSLLQKISDLFLLVIFNSPVLSQAFQVRLLLA